MKQDLIKNYQENEKEIKRISEDRDNLTAERREQGYNLKYKVYDKKIEQLKEERDLKIKVIENQRQQEKSKANQEIDSLNQVITQVSRIIYFLKLKPEIQFNEDKINNKDRYLERLGELYQDDYLKLNLYIYENRKPINKYSLGVVGRCLFGETDKNLILELPYSWGCHINTHESNNNIVKEFKDLLSVELLKDWLNKNRQKLLKDFLVKYQEVKKDYLETIKTYSKEDFKELIKYDCKNCGYFLTEKESREYSRVDGNCPECKSRSYWVKV